MLEGVPYTVVGKIRKKEQDSNYNGPDNSKIFVPFAAMQQDMPRKEGPPGSLSDIVVAPKPWVVGDLKRVLDERTGRILAIGVIDNLVKGAAGQAIQAFNLVHGLPETSGLEQLPLVP